MAIYTVSSLTNEAKTFYDLKLLERALPELVHSQFGQSRPIPPNEGVNINFRKFASLPAATTALTEGTPPSATTLTISTVAATVSQYGAVVDGSDLVSTQSIDNVLTEVAELLGENMGNTLDIIDREILVAGTTVCKSAAPHGDMWWIIASEYLGNLCIFPLPIQPFCGIISSIREAG